MFNDVNEEAEALRIRFLGNAGGLATELASICLIKTKLVYKVFQILDVNATIYTGFAFLDKANLLLSLLSFSKDGLIFCQQLYKWLTELSLSKTVMQPKFASNNDFNLRLLKSVINTVQQPTETTQARKLSDIEMDWYANYNSSPIALKSGARNKFDSDVCWMLPTSGIGFVIYNSDDFKNLGKYKKFGDTRYGYDQIGTKETIDSMIRIAKEWSILYPETSLQYGDISRPGGVNTPDHGTHNNGKVFDVRPLRNDSQIGDGAKLTYNSSSYHRDLTKEFIRIILKLYPATKFHFNDRLIYDDKEFKGIVTYHQDHDNHIHVKFSGGN